MAKLTGPLFSLGASQKLADTLVYFNWKGIPVVRKWVAPANPKTTAQNTQRGYMTDAVAKLHAAQAATDVAWKSSDETAYSLWGSIFATPRTWFNQLCKNWLDQKVASLIPCIWRSFTITPGDTSITVKGYQYAESSEVADVFIHYGTSKTNMPNKVEASKLGLEAGADLTGLTNGVKYFIQVRPKLPITFLGSYSGIYYATPAA